MRPGSSNGGGVGGGGWAQPGSSSNGLGGSSSNIGGGLGGGGLAKPGSSSTGLGSSSGGSSVFGKPGKGGKPSKGKWVKKVVIGAGAVYTGYKVGYGRDASFLLSVHPLSRICPHVKPPRRRRR